MVGGCKESSVELDLARLRRHDLLEELRPRISVELTKVMETRQIRPFGAWSSRSRRRAPPGKLVLRP